MYDESSAIIIFSTRATYGTISKWHSGVTRTIKTMHSMWRWKVHTKRDGDSVLLLRCCWQQTKRREWNTAKVKCTSSRHCHFFSLHPWLERSWQIIAFVMNHEPSSSFLFCLCSFVWCNTTAQSLVHDENNQSLTSKLLMCCNKSTTRSLGFEIDVVLSVELELADFVKKPAVAGP